MRAGEVVRRAGGKVETLRFCVRRGLLADPGRMPGGHRRYGEETVRFLRAILEAQGAGFIPFLCGTAGSGAHRTAAQAARA